MKIKPNLNLALFLFVPFLYNQTCHKQINQTFKISTGGNIMLSQFEAIIKGGKKCFTDDGTYSVKSIDTVMPAVEYLPSHPEINGNVTVSTGIDTRTPCIRNIWDSAAIGFTYYGHCVPKPDVWPYPRNVGYANDVFITAFIPVDTFKKYRPTPFIAGPDNEVLKYAVNVNKVKSLSTSYLCSDDDFIAKDDKYKAAYNNLNQVIGIIAELKMQDNSNVTCYVINNGYDLHWKNPIVIKK